MRRFDYVQLTGSVAFVATLVVCSCSGGDDASSSKLTLENICDVLPRRYCDQDRPCCEQTGFGFDRAHCEDWYRRTCASQVAAVVAHRATFHPENLDTCIAGYQPYEDKCKVTTADYGKAASIDACYRIFEGTIAEGEPCDSFFECAPKKYPDGILCDATCKVVHFAQAGESCESDVCGVTLICDSNALCVADTAAHYIVDLSPCAGAPVILGDAGTVGP